MWYKKPLVRIVVRAVLLLFLCISHAGCEYAATTALTGVSVGVAYLYTNAGEKTVCFDIERMAKATLLALKKMGISICNKTKAKRERNIQAKTKDLNISIELKEITHKSTKIKVIARNGIIKDKATALEIIHQTVEAAESLDQKKLFEAASTI
ncbi:MAG: DUF3568 family protein [Syntrophobacterales bacterium]|nr:MAG: DUF3568 family protein [Syntrophobacterales bacterium]